MIGVGLGIGLAGPTAVGTPAPNPNELLWSEALDNPVWVASGAVVTANAANDPDGQPTADRVNFDPFGTLTQTTTVAASAGAEATILESGGGTYTRIDVSGTYDGAVHYLSAYIKDAGHDIIITIRRAGGFLQVEIQDGGDGATFDIAWVKLETPNLTAYVKREGT